VSIGLHDSRAQNTSPATAPAGRATAARGALAFTIARALPSTSTAERLGPMSSSTMSESGTCTSSE